MLPVARVRMQGDAAEARLDPRIRLVHLFEEVAREVVAAGTVDELLPAPDDFQMPAVLRLREEPGEDDLGARIGGPDRAVGELDELPVFLRVGPGDEEPEVRLVPDLPGADRPDGDGGVRRPRIRRRGRSVRSPASAGSSSRWRPPRGPADAPVPWSLPPPGHVDARNRPARGAGEGRQHIDARPERPVRSARRGRSNRSRHLAAAATSPSRGRCGCFQPLPARGAGTVRGWGPPAAPRPRTSPAAPGRRRQTRGSRAATSAAPAHALSHRGAAPVPPPVSWPSARPGRDRGAGAGGADDDQRRSRSRRGRRSRSGSGPGVKNRRRDVSTGELTGLPSASCAGVCCAGWSRCLGYSGRCRRRARPRMMIPTMTPPDRRAAAPVPVPPASLLRSLRLRGWSLFEPSVRRLVMRFRAAFPGDRRLFVFVEVSALSEDRKASQCQQSKH